MDHSWGESVRRRRESPFVTGYKQQTGFLVSLTARPGTAERFQTVLWGGTHRKGVSGFQR